MIYSSQIQLLVVEYQLSKYIVIQRFYIYIFAFHSVFLIQSVAIPQDLPNLP